MTNYSVDVNECVRIFNAARGEHGEATPEMDECVDAADLLVDAIENAGLKAAVAELRHDVIQPYLFSAAVRWQTAVSQGGKATDAFVEGDEEMAGEAVSAAGKAPRGF